MANASFSSNILPKTNALTIGNSDHPWTIVSPALTGTPTAPTAEAMTNSTQVATTAFVNNTVKANSECYFIDKSLFTNPTTSSSNASSVINAGITAAKTAGKNYCVIPEGTYWLTTTIYLKSDVILCGEGMDVTTLKIADGSDIDAIRVDEPTNNSGIMDLSIDGNRISNYSVYSNGHHGNAINVWLHYGRIERVRTNWVYKHSLLLNYDTGSGDDGLGFTQEHQNDVGNLNKVLWCDFKDSLLQAVMWGWRTMDSWMCYTNIGSHAANLYLEGGTSRFIGNHFDGDGNNGAGPEYNVYCGDGCTAMVFDGNIFENTQKENIYFRQPSYSNTTRTISFTNNIIRTCSKTTDNTYANIYISGYSSSVKAEQIVISGNQILNPDTTANHGYAGIHLNLCKDVKISGNTYFNVGADNVKIESNCNNIVDDDAIASEIKDMSGATNNTAGSHGFVPAPSAGDQNKFLKGNGAWSEVALPSDMTGATSSTAGTHGLVPAPSAGDQNKYFKGDGTWATLTLPSDMTGATASVAGTHGLVPAPSAGSENKFLKGNGQWDTPPTPSDMAGASSSTAGTHGLVPAPASGDQNKYLKGNGTWGEITLPSDMTGSTGSAAGTHGLVPAPAANDNTKYLKGDGTWSTVPLPSDMTGATSSAAGTHGLVPAPTVNDRQKFLRGDGTWALGDYLSTDYIITPSLALSIPQSGGTSTFNIQGLTEFHTVVAWRFSSSAENNPPTSFSWTTGSGTFSITNNGSVSPSETISPVFVRMSSRTVT